eukprot:65072_1
MSIPSWATLLQQYNCTTHEANDGLDYSERLALATAKLLKSPPEPQSKTKNTIPPFYNPQQCESLHKNTDIQIAVAEIARELFLDHQEEKLLSEHDLDCLFNRMVTLLKQHPPSADSNNNFFLNYDIFRKLKESLPPRAHKFFSASVFRKFVLNGEGQLRGISFHQFVSLSLNLLHQFITLCRYDLSSNIVNTNYNQNHSNYLTESDLEIFVSDQIEMIPSLMQIDEAFHPYYIYHAVRKFIFCLNPDNVSKQIPITKILCSDAFREFNEFRFAAENHNKNTINANGNGKYKRNNWFSCENALRVYKMYLELDCDHNGTLSQKEMFQFNQSSLSNLCIQRIFQHKKTWDQEMDYKGFLNFVLAVEHTSLVASLHYFWDILDLDNKGYLTPLTLHTLFRSVQKKMGIFGLEIIPAEDVVTEIIDMVHPKDTQKITKQDLINSKMFGSVIDILTDVKGFWEYDNRESLVAADQQS